MLQGLKEKSLVNETLDKVDALKPIADDLGASLAQLALAWCAKNPHVSTVIMGATKEHQVRSRWTQTCNLAKAASISVQWRTYQQCSMRSVWLS